MARFFGRFEHTLDGKGRLILPAKFRVHFDRAGYLSQGSEGCLTLLTGEAFDEEMAVMEQRLAAGGEDRNLARLWASNSSEVEVDRQGRIAIPAHLRDYAGFGGDVLVNGAIDRIELWDPARWEDKVKRPQEERLANGVDS